MAISEKTSVQPCLVTGVQENKLHVANVYWNCELLFYSASSWRSTFPNICGRRSASACLSSGNADSCVNKARQDSRPSLCRLQSLFEQVSDFQWLWEISDWMRGLIHKWRVENHHWSLSELTQKLLITLVLVFLVIFPASCVMNLLCNCGHKGVSAHPDINQGLILWELTISRTMTRLFKFN